MKATIVPDFMSFRHRLRKGLAGYRQKMGRREISKAELQRILDNDSRLIFGKGAKSTRQFLEHCRFLKFEGDMGELVERIDAEKRPNFIFLAYLGKAQNHIRSPYTNPDISVLAFLNRLNGFAERLSKLAGKEVLVTIAIENFYYDKNILKIRNSTAGRSIPKVMELAKEFKLDKIRFKRLEEMLRIKGWEETFEETITQVKNRNRGTNLEKAYPDAFNILYYLVPTGSFAEAVREYTSSSGMKRRKAITTEGVLRYLAFCDARNKVGFWDANSGYIRSTLSFKPGVPTFNYFIGRLPPLHGTGVLNRGKVGTEYYYDVAEDLASGKRKSASLLYYKKAPFGIELS